MNAPLVAAACLAFATLASHAGIESLFDGHSFKGWDGDTNKTWRIEYGALVGGSLTDTVPRNEFLATTERYTNFVLRLKVRLLGTEGFVNSGIQIRSERVPNHHEMIGYQADVGKGWWGALYDESRRNKILAKPEEGVAERAVKEGEWNHYEMRAEGRRVVLTINGVQTIDYTEPDESLAQFGRIGLQIHGGGKGLVAFKDINLERLP
ncbi:MAG: DUF1080 domain-containing protein [Verrucomicrobiae bacterium]|nr:DUF1080 domain-containing protein [Verrucomicrobiae bacterium]